MEVPGEQGSGFQYPHSSPEEPEVKIPAQVEVAFDVVRWANSVEMGGRTANYETARGGEGRSLMPKERAVYEAALEVLRLYMTGEMTFDEVLREEMEVVEENISSPVSIKAPK